MWDALLVYHNTTVYITHRSVSRAAESPLLSIILGKKPAAAADDWKFLKIL
jgi:hypothetical protein